MRKRLSRPFGPPDFASMFRLRAVVPRPRRRRTLPRARQARRTANAACTTASGDTSHPPGRRQCGIAASPAQPARLRGQQPDCRALLPRSPPITRRERQVGLQKHHLGARRHRGGARPDSLRGHPYRNLLPNSPRLPRRSRKTRHHDRGFAVHAFGTRIHQRTQLRPLGSESELGPPRTHTSLDPHPRHRHGLQHHGNSHLLSAILAKAAGKSTGPSPGTPRRPARLQAPEMAARPRGHLPRRKRHATDSPAKCCASGRLYLNGGQIDGRQVLPEDGSTDHSSRAGRSRYSGQLYGYGRWIRELAARDVYYAWGFGGQFIFVVPDVDAVIVTTALETRGTGRHTPTEPPSSTSSKDIIAILPPKNKVEQHRSRRI